MKEKPKRMLTRTKRANIAERTVIVLFTLSITACSGSAAPPTPTPVQTASTNNMSIMGICGLLLQSELEEVLGEPMASPEQMKDDACYYASNRQFMINGKPIPAKVLI